MTSDERCKLVLAFARRVGAVVAGALAQVNGDNLIQPFGADF
jgi:hypothetical protein